MAFAHFQQAMLRPQTQKEATANDEHVKFGVVKFSSDISLGQDAASEPFHHTGAQELHSQSHKWSFEANLSGC